MAENNSQSQAVGTMSEQAALLGTFECAGVGMAHVALNGRFIRVNSALCEMTGYSRAELMDKTFMEITHPDDLQPGIDQKEKLISQKHRSFTMDKRYLKKDGDVLWVRLTVSLQLDPSGEPLHLVSVIQDITEFRRTLYLQEEQEEGRTAGRAALHALEVMNEAAVLTDLNGIIQQVTPAFSALFNSSPSALQYENLSGLISGIFEDSPSSDAARGLIEESVEQAGRELSSQEPLALKIKPKESIRWILPHVSNVYGKDGRPAGKLFTLRDVSALKQAQIASEESERKYRQLVQQANSIIIQTTPDFMIQFTNEYASSFFGYDNGNLAGRNLLKTLVPARGPDGENLHEQTRRVFDSPELYGSYDQHNRCEDGTWVWVHWSVRAIRNEKGDVSGLLCIGTDITQRKHAEIRADWYRRRSRKLADDLITSEEKERTRMAEYLHDQIIQMLSLANIRMGGVLADIQKADLSAEAKRLEAVRSLIDDAASECRSMMDDLVPSLLHELGLGAALVHLAEKHHVTDGTKIHVDDQLEGVDLPRQTAHLLFQSSRELMMNALKYAGPCEVKIALHAEDEKIHIHVEDNGCGFDIHCLEKSLYADDGGFGLFNIRERLEGLGGQLKVESVKGQGTTASIYVPLPDEPDPL